VGDEAREVRRAALKLLAGLLTYQAGAVAGLLPGLLPRVCALAEVDEAAIAEVQMGVFKVTVDRGQGVRVAALEALGAAVARAPLTQGEVAQVLGALGHGLKWRKPMGTGQFEPVLLSQGVLGRLAAQWPGAVLPALDALAPQLAEVLAGAPFKDAVQQEVDRWAEAHQSALRCVHALARLPGSEASSELGACIQAIQQRPEHLQALEELEAECSRAAAAGAA